MNKFQKIFNKIEEFIFGVGRMQKVKKDLFKSLLTLIASLIMVSLSFFYLISGNYIRGILYILGFILMILSFLKFATDYSTSKFISQFAK